MYFSFLCHVGVQLQHDQKSLECCVFELSERLYVCVQRLPVTSSGHINASIFLEQKPWDTHEQTTHNLEKRHVTHAVFVTFSLLCVAG